MADQDSVDRFDWVQIRRQVEQKRGNTVVFISCQFSTDLWFRCTVVEEVESKFFFVPFNTRVLDVSHHLDQRAIVESVLVRKDDADVLLVEGSNF